MMETRIEYIMDLVCTSDDGTKTVMRAVWRPPSIRMAIKDHEIRESILGGHWHEILWQKSVKDYEKEYTTLADPTGVGALYCDDVLVLKRGER